MGQTTTIAWTDATWNPVIGCSRVSDGCRFCYAESLALRWGWKGNDGAPMTRWAQNAAGHNVVLKPGRLGEPLKWKTPRRVFVNSLSDLFHPEIDFDYIDQVFRVMRATPQHTYQVLTKRPERAAEYSAYCQERTCYDRGDGVTIDASLDPLIAGTERDFSWPFNVWMGTSIELNRHVDRADHLRRVRCAVRFLSCEPLLGPLPDLDLRGIHWVIVGGESGVHMGKHPERWMDHAWARAIRDMCQARDVAFFFKQSSGLRPGAAASLEEEDGGRREWHEFPTPPMRQEVARHG